MEITFDENTGLLPPGEHKLSLKDFNRLFVYNRVRENIFKGFLLLLKDLGDISCSHVYVDGSYVTDKPHPGDIDVAWQMADADSGLRSLQLSRLKEKHPILFDFNLRANRDEIKKKYFADVFPANTREGSTGLMFKDFFQRDGATGAKKGIIVIDLL